MSKTGEGLTGEVKTGETNIKALAAPKQNLGISQAVLTGPYTGEVKTGEARSGGIVRTHDIQNLGAFLSAPKQTTGLKFNTQEIGYPVWVVDGTALRVQSVTLTPTSLSLDIRARTDAERTLLDTLDANAGKLETRERADGTTLGRDTSGGSNTFTVYPPIRHVPERVTRTWHCDNVSRERTSADTRGLAATLEFVADETRAPVAGLANTSQTDYWEFDFGTVGTITTPRVSTVTQEATTSLDVILTAAQAELFETTAAATAGAVVTTVPDGTSFTRDATPDNRQTVTITPPSTAADPPISPGDYVIEDWTSEGADGEAYRVTMQLSSRYESG